MIPRISADPDFLRFSITHSFSPSSSSPKGKLFAQEKRSPLTNKLCRGRAAFEEYNGVNNDIVSFTVNTLGQPQWEKEKKNKQKKMQ